MKDSGSRILLCSMLACSLASIGVAQEPRGRHYGGPPTGPAPVEGTYTTVSGSILQFNYDREAEIEGFLLNDHTLVHLPPRVADRAGSLLRAGDSVQITGFARTAPTGFQTVEAQNVQDRTSGKTLTVPQPGPAAPFSGSGRIEHLNYGPNGAVNGFLLDNGTLATVAPFASTNPSSIRVGVPITYSGFARNTISGRTVVDVQTLSINGQTLTMGAMRPIDGPGAPPPPPAPAGAPNGAPTAPPVPRAPAGTVPAGRGDEPPLPPAPIGPPKS